MLYYRQMPAPKHRTTSMYRLAAGPPGEDHSPDFDEERRKRFAAALAAGGKAAGDKLKAPTAPAEDSELLQAARKRVDARLQQKRRQSVLKTF